MKNEFKNVIVYGELDYILSANFDEVKDKAKVLEYTANLLPIDQNDNGSTNTNCLYVVNNMLEKILNFKAENNNNLNETCYITIPDKLYKAIQRGTYKTWIKNDGHASTGYAYAPREIEEWIRFTNLYSSLFLDINFRSMTYYTMSNPRYHIDNVNRHKYLIKQMRNQVEKHKQNMLNSLIASY